MVVTLVLFLTFSISVANREKNTILGLTCRVGAMGSYLSPLSDMSPATSDCLEPGAWSLIFLGFFLFSFPIIACVLTFLGPFISF